MLHNIT